MPTFFETLDKTKADEWFSSQSHFFHCFSLFNSCLGVVSLLDRGDYPENLHVVLCPNK